MSLLDAFQPKKNPPGQPPQPDFVQLRTVPFQPPETPLGQVFMGSDLGFCFYAGAKPRAGDVVAAIGQPGTYVVLQRPTPPERDPIFLGSCRCRCPASSDGGMIAYLTKIQTTSILIIVDGSDGTVLDYSTLNDVISAEGVAIDPSAPHDMYILDSRLGTTNLPADQIPPQDPTRQWFCMQKYATDGSGYQFQTAELLPGAFAETIDSGGYNALSVIDAVCHITVGVPPARFLKWSGSGFTTVNLLQDGDAYNAHLFGPIVRVESRPARQNHLYSLAVFNPGFTNDFQLLRFTPEGTILSVLQSDKFVDSQALLTVCNRLYVFQSFGPFRGSFSESEPPEEDDDGDTEGPGEET